MEAQTKADKELLQEHLESLIGIPEYAEESAALTRLLAAFDEAEAEIKKLFRIATDRIYMMTAYRQMLGPKGCEVADMWDAKGVTRQHTSWGTEAAAMTGEERAQVHLDIEAMPKTEMKNLGSPAARVCGLPRSALTESN